MFSNNIKRFFIRKILRQIYSKDEIIGGEILVNDMNANELKLHIELLTYSNDTLHKNVLQIIEYLSNIPAPCDKCNNYSSPGSNEVCFKCENTGIVQHQNLLEWGWE